MGLDGAYGTENRTSVGGKAFEGRIVNVNFGRLVAHRFDFRSASWAIACDCSIVGFCAFSEIISTQALMSKQRHLHFFRFIFRIVGKRFVSKEGRLKILWAVVLGIVTHRFVRE